MTTTEAAGNAATSVGESESEGVMIEEIDERVHLTFEQAESMLPDEPRIHTMRSTGPVGICADWPRDELLGAIRMYGAELTGPTATKAGYSICLVDERGPLFIRTKGVLSATTSVSI